MGPSLKAVPDCGSGIDKDDLYPNVQNRLRVDKEEMYTNFIKSTDEANETDGEMKCHQLAVKKCKHF